LAKADLGARERAILRALQGDGGQSLRELAKAAGIPVSTAHETVKRLERAGVIRGYCAVIDAGKLGLPVTGFAFISLQGAREPSEVAGEIAAVPGVQEVHLVSGGCDIIAKLKAESVESLGALVARRLRPVKGVSRAEAQVAFRSVKEGAALEI
jgi:DNA-binding Lrp family transcriptional regulator